MEIQLKKSVHYKPTHKITAYDPETGLATVWFRDHKDDKDFIVAPLYEFDEETRLSVLKQIPIQKEISESMRKFLCKKDVYYSRYNPSQFFMRYDVEDDWPIWQEVEPIRVGPLCFLWRIGDAFIGTGIDFAKYSNKPPKC